MSDPVYLTIVYQITHPAQQRALLKQAEWSVSSKTNAIQERDKLQAENDDFRATCDHLTRENAEQIGEIVALKEQRDELRNSVKRLHAAKGRYHTQHALCDLFDICGLPNERPTK